jgi:apolipoprotein N-acyltransferase
MIRKYMVWKKWSQWVFPVVSGALAAAAMPGMGGAFLILVALIPLFHEISSGRGFRAGLLFGVAFFAIDLRWILTLYRFTPLVVPGFALMLIYLALPVGLLGFVLARLRRRCGDVRWALAAAAGFALLEFLRSLGPLGISFSSLYLSFHRVPSFVQLAALLGPYAITAAIVGTNAFLYGVLRRRDARFALGALASVAVLVAPSLVPIPPDSGPRERVAVVSSLVEQEAKLNTQNLATLLARYGALADQAVATDPDLVVFPESFLPTYILRTPSVLARLVAVARDSGARVLFGTGDLREGDVYNCAVLLDRTGDVVALYAKARPVPFGEYIPGRSAWEALGLGPLMDSFLPHDLRAGRDEVPLDRIGTPICFEATFPDGPRALVRRGATLLVTVTNDAWFNLSSQRDAHFAFAVFRAVENRRWMIQAANGGVSGVVSPSGQVTASTRDEGVVVGEVFERSDVSVYTRWGDLPALCAFGIAILLAVPRGRSAPSERGRRGSLLPGKREPKT